MEINKEFAIKFWTKQFGKTNEAYDFAGRRIVKGAYDDRHSDYGWNIDHIYPQSKGGKDVEYNLQCTHIDTNAEKTDKFPCFKANNKEFEIVKRDNRYVIQERKNLNDEQEMNFLDHSVGINFISKLVKERNSKPYISLVSIALFKVKSYAVIDFITELFDDHYFDYEITNQYKLGNIFDILITFEFIETPFKSDVQYIMDTCTLLNTYLSCYFNQIKLVKSHSIVFEVLQLDNWFSKEDCYERFEFDMYNSSNYPNLFINYLVKSNTDVSKIELENFDPFPSNIELSDKNRRFYKFNYTFKKLANNLKKEVSK